MAAAAQLACELEVSAEKPGNVTPTVAFQDTGYEDFLQSAAALAPEMAKAGERSVGDTVLAVITATRQRTQANTNLGIALLFAPLAKAALTDGVGLRRNLQAVLHGLTQDDARSTYKAIRLAAPGGFKEPVENDIRTEPTTTLREAMAGAVERDSIAAEYLSDYRITFELGLPALQSNLERGISTDQAIIQTYLELLANVPDTLIARKCGFATARKVSREAQAVLTAGGVFSPDGRRKIAALDGTLRSRNSNRLNPGTTADLIAATLFVALLEGTLEIENTNGIHRTGRKPG